VLYAWAQIASRLENGDASCRLYDPIDLLAADTAIPPDRVAGILHMGCELEYESINGRPFHVFDRDANPPYRFGADLIFYKMDNATRNKEWAQTLRSQRRQFEFQGGTVNGPLASDLQATCNGLALHTYRPTDRQTYLPLVENDKLVVGGPGPDPMTIDHIKGKHEGRHVDGCPVCEMNKVAKNA